jgi:flagellar protein FliO/FliZ
MLAEFGWVDWLSMIGSFVFVIALLVATLLMLKKMGPRIGVVNNRRLNIIEIQNLGARQKLLLVSVNNDQVLIGLSPQGITPLGRWGADEQIGDLAAVDPEQEGETPDSQLNTFKQLLSQTIRR